MIKLQYLTMSGNCWVNTNVTPNSTCVFYSKFVPLIENQNIDWATWWGSNTTDDNANTYQLRRFASTDDWKPQVGSVFRTGNVDTILWGKTNEVTMDVVNGSATINGNSYTASQCSWNSYANGTVPIFVGANNKNGSAFRVANASWDRFSITKEGVLAIDLIPVIDENDEVCFYDNVSGNYFYASGTGEMIAGPSIIVTPTKKSFPSEGGNILIDVQCYNTWTVSSDAAWLTLSSTGETGDSTITATAPSYSDPINREALLTFTDTTTSDVYELTLIQKKYSLGQPLHLGAVEIADIYLGDGAISAAYLGDVQVYSSGPFTGLKLSPQEYKFNPYILSGTCKVKASEPWTMTVPAWITASTLTGTSGETTVVLSTTADTASTTGTIVATSANFTASASCEYNHNPYNPVTYIWENGAGYLRQHCLDTGVAHTASTMVVEVDYIGRGNNSNCDRIVGYQPGDSGCSGDANDFRIFGYQNGTFDYGNERMASQRGNMTAEGEWYGLYLTDCYVDDENDHIWASGSTQGTVPSPGCHIYVDVSYIKVRRVAIYSDSTLSHTIFDGRAAEVNGQYGLYDLVGHQFITNPDVSIIGPQ